jgi:cytochrome P450 monooxygenase-1
MVFNLQDAISKYQHFDLSSPYVAYGIAILALCYWWNSTKLDNPSGLPVVGRKWYELGYGKARQRFRDDCLGTVRSCTKKVSDVSTWFDCLS